MSIDYSRRAEDYDAARSDPVLDREYWLRGLVEVGGIRPGERVLDLGAGTGRFASLLHPEHRVFALDSERRMLEVARGKGSFPCIQADGHRLPFRNDAFDVALLVMVIHQVTDYRKVLREVGRVSRRVVIATSDMTTRRLGILEEAFPSLLAIDRTRFPPPESLVAALEDSGFRDIHSEARPYMRTFAADEQLDRVRRRYLSTFDLLPPGEFERGLRFLEREIPRRYGDRFEMKTAFTFLAGTR